MLAITGTVVFGMASTASATPEACASRTAAPGDTISQFVYDWGLSWRNPLDVWRVAQANPAITNPNSLAVGEVVTDCPATATANLAVPVVTHGLQPGESLRSLESGATGDWHWPIPEWVLAQANPSLPSPDAGTVGEVVRLLPGASPALAQAQTPPPAPAVVSPPPAAGAPSIVRAVPLAPAPAPVIVLPPTTSAPHVTVDNGPAIVTSSPTTAPSTTEPPAQPAPTVPLLPPATLPPDPPKIVEPSTDSTSPSDPGPSDKQSAPPTTADNISPPVTPPTTAAPTPPPVAAIGALIHPHYAGPVDPADPNVVAHVFAEFAKDDPGVTPRGDAWIVGGWVQESGLNPNAVGDGGEAHGIGQWHEPRTCGESTDLDAQIACGANEIIHNYPTVQAVITDPNATDGALDHAEKVYEGYGKAGPRGRYERGIAGQVAGGKS
ncbi:MAG TPA: phage tail tip lysozyme [Acidimicrobiales bacterium]|nr:phage tail tip lysozyme [Acidimicrobiales bacterium]